MPFHRQAVLLHHAAIDGGVHLDPVQVYDIPTAAADKVAVRLNVICSYRITNPEKLVQTVEGVASQLYTCVKLKLREYVGRYRLDELLV